jgi:hypothetical protein
MPRHRFPKISANFDPDSPVTSRGRRAPNKRPGPSGSGVQRSFTALLGGLVKNANTSPSMPVDSTRRALTDLTSLPRSAALTQI